MLSQVAPYGFLAIVIAMALALAWKLPRTMGAQAVMNECFRIVAVGLLALAAWTAATSALVSGIMMVVFDLVWFFPIRRAALWFTAQLDSR